MHTMKQVKVNLASEICTILVLMVLSATAHAQNTAPVQQQQSAPTTTPAKTPTTTLTPQEPANDATPEDAADIFFAQGRFQAAIEAYKKVDPPTASGLNKMGMSYQKMYNLEEAKKCYDAALKIDSKNVNYLNNLGSVYAQLRLFGPAEKTYKRALKLDPADALVYKNLGMMYMTDGKIVKGRHCFEEAQKLDPKIFSTRGAMSVDAPTDVRNRGAMNYFMARSCAQSGLTDCAISYLRAAMSEGYTNAKKLATDPEFASLRNVYAFQQMLAEQDTKTAPTVSKDSH
jgi:tetratricopeptide (TPR) repeat protein